MSSTMRPSDWPMGDREPDRARYAVTTIEGTVFTTDDRRLANQVARDLSRSGGDMGVIRVVDTTRR